MADNRHRQENGQGNRQGPLSPAIIETIAGITAGSIATLIVHPLDIVKTRMQIHRSLCSPGAPPLTTIAVMRTLTTPPNPLRSMYRGLSVNIAGNAASWGAFFYLKTEIERGMVYLKGDVDSLSLTIPTSTTTTPSAVDARRTRLTPLDFFLSSAIAGATTALLTNPLWVLKTRLLSTDRFASGAYPGAMSGLSRLWQTEGWRGFYRGLAISMVGVTHGAVHFAVYEPAKKMYLRWRSTRRTTAPTASISPLKPPEPHPNRAMGNVQTVTLPDERISNEATLLLSSSAKLVAGAVTYPYQVIRSRVQNYNSEERFGKGIRGVAVRVWTEEGIVGFYRGVVPGTIRVLPATWITFLVYENVKFGLPKWMETSSGR